jgi:hypothetical protein
MAFVEVTRAVFRFFRLGTPSSHQAGPAETQAAISAPSADALRWTGIGVEEMTRPGFRFA